MRSERTIGILQPFLSMEQLFKLDTLPNSLINKLMDESMAQSNNLQYLQHLKLFIMYQASTMEIHMEKLVFVFGIYFFIQTQKRAFFSTWNYDCSSL